ncbi:MAG TPA: oxygenase MpaB family protein [Streptosporangiaceae bacterium]|nr:oxygenase MpaB family protein [Streptosporangiaceae bacterium]
MSRPAEAGPGDSVSSGDTGLFGPGSVTWRIASEPVMWIAGLRAMYLQALHPRVMLGTWQNTALARPDEAWGRFTRTVKFVRVRTFGTTAEVERAGARLRKIHASLRGTDTDGRDFRLDEPELLLWVHCCEIGSYAEIARRSGVHVRPDELDAFIDEQRRSAAVVGLDPATVPRSMAGLAAYFDRMRPSLRVTPEARQAMRASFTPKVPPALLPLRLLVPPLNVLGYATLPAWARRLYGTPGLALTEPAVTLALRTTFETTTRLPPAVFVVPGAALSRHGRRHGQPTARLPSALPGRVAV